MSEAEVKNEAQGKGIPEAEVQEAVGLAKAAKLAQDCADNFKSLATKALDPKEREQYLRQAHAKEIEAHGNSRKARAIASGWGQGAAGGFGMGGAVGAGLGTVVGTLVGSVASIPTSLLGAVGGTAVGALHGPWIKLGGGDKKEKEEKVAPTTDEGKDTIEVEEVDDDEEEFSDEEGHQAVLKAAQQAEEYENGGNANQVSTVNPNQVTNANANRVRRVEGQINAEGEMAARGRASLGFSGSVS